MPKMKKAVKNRLIIKSIIIGSAAAFLVFLTFGVVTVLIKNPFFIRMTPVYWYDYVFLVLTSLFSGAYMGLWHYNKNNAQKINSKCDYTAAGGTFGGFFSFSCAICNKLLIWLFGLSWVVAYFTPFQPILGIISIALLSYAVCTQLKVLSILNNKTKFNFVHGG